jgi:hypothetical protein
MCKGVALATDCNCFIIALYSLLKKACACFPLLPPPQILIGWVGCNNILPWCLLCFALLCLALLCFALLYSFAVFCYEVFALGGFRHRSPPGPGGAGRGRWQDGGGYPQEPRAVQAGGGYLQYPWAVQGGRGYPLPWYPQGGEVPPGPPRTPGLAEGGGGLPRGLWAGQGGGLPLVTPGHNKGHEKAMSLGDDVYIYIYIYIQILMCPYIHIYI